MRSQSIANDINGSMSYFQLTYQNIREMLTVKLQTGLFYFYILFFLVGRSLILFFVVSWSVEENLQ